MLFYCSVHQYHEARAVCVLTGVVGYGLPALFELFGSHVLACAGLSDTC
jgi:hypothetical protein